VQDSWCFEDIGDPQVEDFSLSFFEEQDELAPTAVVVSHPDLLLVPDERLPETKPDALGDGLRDEHRGGVAEQVKMGVSLEHPPYLTKKLLEA
jgi:hypothetical protein